MGLLYGIGLRLMNLMVFFLIVVLLPLGPPTTFPFKAFEVTPPKELKGALEPNHHVDGAERLLDQRVYGPECLIVRNNEIYTGIHGGEVIKLTAEHATHVVKLGQPCEDIFEESRCGRPLGLAFDTIENNLIIADAYYGLWQVDLKTHKKKLLVSPQQELAGKGVNRPAKIFNSVAVDQRGDIYWTDSSSDFTIQDLVFTSFANPSGRLFKYDRSKNVSSVLLDELNFANGLALSPDEDFIVIAETGAMRLTKYHLKGPKTGQSEVFVDGLPGLPDNLTPDADGIWVPLVVASDSDHPSGFSIFSNFPTLRLFFMRLLYVFEAPFKLLNTYYPNKLAQRFVHFIGHGESILLLNPKRATIVRVDWHGSIVGSLHGFDKSVGAVSHVLEHNDQLYLGSPFNRFLARVKSPRAAAAKQSGGVKIKNVRYEGVSMEPIVTQPKDEPTTTKTTTTTTPKPKPTTTAKATTTTTSTTTTTTTTTTRKPTTTTPRPTTTTTTPRPTTTARPTTTPKPATTTTAKPAPTTTKRVPPAKPAPVEEHIPADTKPPQKEKLKVIDKQGKHVEL